MGHWFCIILYVCLNTNKTFLLFLYNQYSFRFAHKFVVFIAVHAILHLQLGDSSSLFRIPLEFSSVGSDSDDFCFVLGGFISV